MKALVLELFSERVADHGIECGNVLESLGLNMLDHELGSLGTELRNALAHLLAPQMHLLHNKLALVRSHALKFFGKFTLRKFVQGHFLLVHSVHEIPPGREKPTCLDLCPTRCH